MNFVKTYQEMVETYYSPFSFKIGENAPKLTKQLTKAGKVFTVEEIQAFQELLNAVYNNEKEEAYTFDDSCNSKGNAGEFTVKILMTMRKAILLWLYSRPFRGRR